MKTEIGEFVVGAYLKIILGCDFVDYNVRPPGGGLEGLSELDVVGLDFKSKTAYLCEVTTHIGGLLYGSSTSYTVEKIAQKHEMQKKYAKKHLTNFPTKYYMFWSPVVPVGKITEGLGKIKGLELIINEKYTEKIDELRKEASKRKNDEGNPFFRTLQILEHLRRKKSRDISQGTKLERIGQMMTYSNTGGYFVNIDPAGNVIHKDSCSQNKMMDPEKKSGEILHFEKRGEAMSYLNDNNIKFNKCKKCKP